MNIIIAGDFCPHDRVATLMEYGKYSEIFEDVKSIIKKSDYSVVNFECPIVTDPNDLPIYKCGPNLRIKPNAIELIKYAGFKCVTLANNHFLDYGVGGVIATLRICDNAGIDRIGGGMDNKEASMIFYKEIDNKLIALINCCEHEFSIATEHSAGSNAFDPIKQYYAICEAHSKADYVIVITHGGHEGYPLPSPRMQETFRFFIDCGADVVINHHQHCYSGYEVYKDKPIFYGLGNFCFDYSSIRNLDWNQGYMVELKIDKNIDFVLWPYNQCNECPCVRLMDKEEKEIFFDNINKLNEVINAPLELARKHNEWMSESNKNYLIAFSPYSNRYFRGLCKLGIIPSFLTKRRATVLLDYINCESHRERVINSLCNFLYKS